MTATDPTGYLSIPPDLIRGAAWKQPCRVATTANITIASALNVGDSIDGVALAAGDRVLVKDQSTGSQNGIYVAGATPARAFDMDQDLTTAVPAEEIAGAFVYVIAGTANAGKLYRTTNVGGGTIGSTTLTFTEFAPTAGLTGIDFLVGTATGLLSGEIVAGTTPGGELGGTWASPTVDATHSGSAHLALGTTGSTAAAGNDSRLSDARTPTGAAGGDLSGTYPNPSVVDDSHAHTSSTLPTAATSRILLADGRSTPFAFTDLLQADDGSDFLWSD